VASAFELELVEIEFNCCGYPVRGLSFDSFLLSAARNLALAEKSELDIMTPCQCCFGSLQHARHFLQENPKLADEVNGVLAEEKLEFNNRVQVKHLLTVLAEDIGLEAIKKQVRRPFKGLKVAAHYGCHALRPANVTHFDDPFAPVVFEKLIAVTGAECVSWRRRLECCGQPVQGKNDQLSFDLMNKKLLDAKESGAHCLAVACTYCQTQFDIVRATVPEQAISVEGLPSLLYTQLLGMTMGLGENVLGLSRNKIDNQAIKSYLA
jgi:heterodisulfide reductase subunit B